MNILSQMWKDVRNPVTARIGITTTIGYGTLFYSFAVFAPLISSEFEIGLDTFFAIFAIGLVVGGLFAPMIGARVDKMGARTIMTAGSLVAAIALVLVSFAPNIWYFSASIIVLELASAMVLYEAAFAGLTQIYGQGARAHITSVTLIAGFASTIFWPLTQFLSTEFGWRGALMIYAAAHLLVCLPLNWKFGDGVRPEEDKRHQHRTEDAAPVADNPRSDEIFLQGRARTRAIWLYGISVAISGMVLATVPVHMVVILKGEGITAGAAALVSMVVGPCQVLARIIEMVAATRYSPLASGRYCLAMLPIALSVLLLPVSNLASAIAFAACYGTSQGLANIIRGSVPLYLFGSKGYGALVGKITAVRFFLNAGAPMIFAIFITNLSLNAAIWFIFAMAFVAAIVFFQINGPKLHENKTALSLAE